ncbi:MAG: Na+/H+ antiporter NhaC [Melioribacteraceae bacterium]|nr:Na+/H+ antiporter NhaC [Melioribacteraceae bacterium]
MAEKVKRKPTLTEALIPFIVMAFLLGVGYGVFKLRIEVLLLTAASVAGLLGLRLGFNYKEMQTGIMESIHKGMPAMSIVIIVGMLIGTWIAAGTIPMIIYYGLEIISPQYFLITASIVCSVISLVTGSSYGTVGTIGIAFMGIAHGMGIPLAQAAGAIVAGAYFGDKISPFSDTTNLAPIAAGSNLFDHIRHLLWTTTPAWMIGLIIYYFVGLGFEADPSGEQKIDTILLTLENNYNFSIFLLLPLLTILYLTVRKKPAIPGMLLSSVIAIVLAYIFQNVSIQTSVHAAVFGFSADTGLEVVDKLLTRGGMVHMMEVTLIAFCAFAFGGVVQVTFVLDKLLSEITKYTTSVGKLIASTVATSITTAVITGSSFLAILIPGELFAPIYKEKKLAAKNLSRTTEDSGTVVVPLIPWSIAGVYMAGTLGVPTLEYAPWAFMCYLGFIIALIYGFAGIKIAPKIREDETQIGS